jgi:hypothetical protein
LNIPTYPNYVYQTLARARDIGQWYCGQSDAAALCFDILALFPDCTEASDLVYELFCDEWKDDVPTPLDAQHPAAIHAQAV